MQIIMPSKKSQFLCTIKSIKMNQFKIINQSIKIAGILLFKTGMAFIEFLFKRLSMIKPTIQTKNLSIRLLINKFTPSKMTQKSFAFLLLMLALAGMTNRVQATHLMGGDFTYRYLYTQSNKVYYETKLVLYRNCNSATGFGNPICMGVYKGTNYGSIGSRSVYIYGGKANNVTPTCIPASGICIEEAIYIDTLNYPTNQSYGVYVTCGGTARNNAIVNLDLTTGNAGMALQIYIPPPNQYINSSPAFVNKPLPFLCTGKQMVFSNNAYDADGDSVVFSFVLPYGSNNPGGGCPTSGYPVPPPLSSTPCKWASGYSVSQPFGSSGSIVMDTFTGEITATAPAQSNYVIAIEIQEYRTLSNGSVVLMSAVRRDLQVVSKTCANYYPPKLVSYGSTTAKSVKVGDSICFNITGADSLGDSVFISASGVMFDTLSGGTPPLATFTKKGGDSLVTQQFCWKPGCNHARSQPYIMTVDLINANCGSDQKTFTVTVNQMPTGNTPQLRCADVVSSNQVKITWINPASQSSYTTKYYVLRKPISGSYTLIDSVSLTATSYTDNSVTNATSTQYVYQIVPVNTCGNYGSGNSISTILLSGTLSGQSVVNLTWNDPTSVYKPYKFFLYKDDGSGTWTYADSTVNDSISQYARGCTSSHRYKVVAYDSVGGCTSSSTYSSFYTLKDKLPPVIQGFVKATITPSGQQVQLEWKPNDSLDVAWFYVYRKTTGAFVFLDSVKSNSSLYYKYIDNTANINSGNLPYHYKIQAVDSCGNIGSMYEPHAPVNLQGQAQNFRVKLWWYNYQGFKGFSKVVLVRADTGSNYVWAAYKTLTVSDSIVYDSAVSCYSRYWYKVQFYDVRDTTLYTESDTIILTPTDTIKPEAASVEMATVISGTQINLLFNPSVSKDVDRYFIYKSTNGGSYVLDTVLTYPPGNPIIYTDKKVDALNNRYCYYIKPHDSCQNLESVDSTIHCAMQLHAQPGNNRVFLQFYGYKGFAVSDYNIQRWNNGSWLNIHNETAGDTSFIDSVGVHCKLNYYRIQALYQGGYPTSYSDTIAIQPFDTQPPPRPVFDYVITTNHTRLDLNWSQTDKDVNRLILYRALNNGIPVPYDTLPGTTTHYSDSNVDAAKYHYTYTLEAFDSCSNNSSGKALQHNSINLDAQLDICNRLYKMKWNTYKNWPANVAAYQLYRSSNGGAYSVYKNFSYIDSTYTDTAISVNTFYRYVIVALENGGGGNMSKSDTVNFDFKNVRGPVIHSVSKVATSTTNGAVLIAWKALELDSFVKFSRLYYSSTGTAGSYSLLKDNISLTRDTFTHMGINTRTKNHWYYMVSVDSCNIVTDSNGFHKTMDLSVTLKKLRNKLNWTPYLGWKVGSYIIMRQDTGGFYPAGTVAGIDTFFTDFPSPCNGYVTYAVVAKDTNGVYYSLSDTVTLPPIDTAFIALGVLKNVTVHDNQVIQIDIVEQDSVSIFGYAIKRKERDSSNWTQRAFLYSVAPGNVFTFYDTADVQNRYYNYQVAVVDSCLNASYSVTFSQMQLTGKAGHLQNTLTWNKFAGYNTQRYEVTELLPNGGFLRLDTLSPSDSTWTHDSLLCNISHTYFIIAVENNTGRESYSDTIILTPFDSVPPAQVKIINATVVNNNTLTVNWQASSADVGQYVLSCKSPNGNWIKVDTLSASTLTYDITPLPVADSAYSVSIIAYDSCAMNASAVSATHTSVNLSGNAVNLGVKLNWNIYTGFPIKDQEVERFIDGAWSTIIITDDKTNIVSVDTLGCNTSQYFRIKTNGFGGVTAYSDSILLIPYDTIKPEPAVVKLATVVNSNLIRLEWFASASPDVKFYNIYRNNGSGIFTNIAQVTNVLYYNDSTVSANQQSYSYYVVAIDSCNTNNISIPSDTECTVKLQFHYQACFPEINISWSAYKYFGDKLSKYEVYRKDSLGVKSLYIADSNTLTYKDSGINLGSTYSYVVVASSSDGTTYSLSDTLDVVPYNFPFSKAPNIYNATTTATSSTVGEVTFNWAKTTDTLVRKYQIYYWNGSPFSKYYLYYETTNMNDTSYVMDSIDTQNGKNYFKMVFRDLCDREGAYTEVHKTMDLSVTPGNLQVSVDWNKYEGWPVANYKVWRSDNVNAPAVIAVTDSSTTSYIDTMVSCTYTYSYYVEASELFGDFTLSNSNVNTAVTFDTIPPPRIKIDYATVNTTDPANAEVEVFFNASTDRIRTGYNIYLNDSGTFFKLKNVYPELNSGKLSFAVQGLNTQYLANGFYITATDSCDNESAPSDTHTVVQLQANSVSGSVDLSWSKYIGFTVNNYLLERMSAGQTAWTAIGQFAPTVTNFSDSFATCNLTYYYRITARDSSGLISLSDTVGVLTFEIDPPNATTIISATVTATSVTNGEVKINWNASTSDDVSGYIVYYRTSNDSNWILATAFTSQLNYKVSGLNTVDSVYYFKVAVWDSCGNISTTFSPAHASIVLVAVPGEQNISLNWNNYIGWQADSFIVLRNGKRLASVPSNVLSYIDSPLSCVRVMYYQIKAVSSLYKTYSMSDSSYTRPYDHTPPAPSYIKFATVYENNHTAKIEFTASKTFDIAFYDIFRKPNGTNGWVKIARTSDTIYYDSTVDASHASYCYRIQSGDSCSNYSVPSNEACLIWLKGKSYNLSNHLNFTPYTFWNKGVDHYEVYRTDDSNMTNLILTTTAPPIEYLDSLVGSNNVENFCYVVKGIENLGGYDAVTFSNQLCLHQQPLVYFPNTFTPNDDDLNETFGPTGLYYKKYDMEIIDRWGGVIFTNSEAKPRWDAKFGNGAIVPMGVYIYRVKIYSYDGKEINYNGVIQILR